jgi:hypothetical protein
MLSRGILLSTMVLMTGGCLTTAKKPPVLPGALAPFFGTCSIDDGAAALQLFESGALLASAEIEWTSKSRDRWDLEVMGPAGNTLAKVARHGLYIEAKGPESRRLPTMGVSLEDHLLIDEHFTGLKAQEVLCILSGRLPYEWLGGLIAIERQKHETTLLFNDDDRKITTIFETFKDIEPRICTRISWNEYWFFSHDIKWCISEKNQRHVTLEGWLDYSLKWVRIE